MANAHEVSIAKRLLTERIVPDSVLRECFALQERLREQGKNVSLERVIYHLKVLPKGSLRVLSAPSPLESQPFEDYHLEEYVGEGGSSTVYAGTYRPNRASVAVKVLDPVQALRPEFFSRFRQEAELLVELEHENIVCGYHVGTGLDPSTGGAWNYFSMDLVDGMTVLETIDRRGFLSNEEALSITLQTARALGYLHSSGFLHRDIKPGNIMVEADGRARLIDLGLSRRLSDDDAEDSELETMTVGTMEYVSPEQARGRSDLDPRSDIYSLGVSLYHMVVGETPFSGDTDYEVMAKQVLSAMDSQKVKKRRISPEIQYFITKMMSKDRDDRYDTVDDAIEDIAGYIPEFYVPIDFGDDPVVAPIQPVSAPPISVKPVQPVKRVRSVQPVKPSGSAPSRAVPLQRPVASVKPIQPVEPVPQVKPVRPIKSVKPVAPVPTVKPVASVPTIKPVEPASTPETAPPMSAPKDDESTSTSPLDAKDDKNVRKPIQAPKRTRAPKRSRKGSSRRDR